MYISSHISPLSPTPPVLVHRFFEDSVQAVNNSNLHNFFYGAACNAVSTIDCSKEFLDADNMDNPLPKKTFRPSLSMSPLKRGRPCQDLWLGLPFLV